MAGEKGLDRRRLYLTIDEELAHKIEKAYTRKGDKYPTDAFSRALEFAARSVRLTEADWARIEERIKANARARVELRSRTHVRSYKPRDGGSGEAKMPERVRASVRAIMQGGGETGGAAPQGGGRTKR